MILPESLHPGMTRGGFSYRARVPIRQGDEYPVTGSGLWLPPTYVAERKLEHAEARLDQGDRPAFTNGEALARVAVKQVMLHDVTGCWVGKDSLEDDEHTEALWEIADHDMGGPPLNEKSDDSKHNLRICDQACCLNARHYDFTHRKAYREELIAPNLSDYRVLTDGRLLPIWEHSPRRALPSVADSAQALRDLQLRCPPFADASQAPLSANGISKITLDPDTGCWMVRMYYTRPEHHLYPGFQFDGYGRLGKGKGLRKEGEPANQMLAHRVIWQAVGKKLQKGKELNHMCGVRPCANPGHLEQVSKSKNNRHAYAMNQARAQSK